MAEINELSSFEIDALKETANIGTGNASIALSALLNQKVLLTLPETNIINAEEVSKKISGQNQSLVGIYTKAKEGLDGNILLLFPITDALNLIENVRKGGSTEKKDSLSGEDLIIMKKLGAVLCSAYLTSLAKFFEQRIIFQQPNVISVLGDSIADFMISQIGDKEKVLLITVGFNTESKKVNGDFVLLFTLSSLNPLLQKLKQKMGMN
ncbi:chemotaxis protein CheC [Candidatus Woesearchaeota archaeon]|nr:chemotaxis protein CheC [Candidatus Woesearchaeota archaeon]